MWSEARIPPNPTQSGIEMIAPDRSLTIAGGGANHS
jgi:hypothetical protein